MEKKNGKGHSQTLIDNVIKDNDTQLDTKSRK